MAEENKKSLTMIEGVQQFLVDRKARFVKDIEEKPHRVTNMIKMFLGLVVACILGYREICILHVKNTHFNPADARCESLNPDVNLRSMEFLALARNQGNTAEVRQDKDKTWLITVDAKIGGLTGADVAHFTKYINCSEKFVWLHPENNVLSYWVEAFSYNRDQQDTDESNNLPNIKKRVRNGDTQRTVRKIGGSELEWETVISDNFCTKEGSQHVCTPQEGEDIVYRGRIQTNVVWFGSYKVGKISTSVVHNAGSENILRTRIEVGGADSKLASKSLLSRIVNLVVIPVVQPYLYAEDFVHQLAQHYQEESQLAAALLKIPQS